MSHESPSASSARAEGRIILWDASFARVSPLFWPVEEAARALAEAHHGGSFPTPELIDAALGGRAQVRFERQKPVPRRRRSAERAGRDPSSMYDARIAREGCVPTRPGSWHDLMNALVWATFPRAKRALHERQHGLVVPAAPGESARRPRELDALALLDEGGVLVLSPQGVILPDDEEALEAAIARGEARAMVFGHAIYEGLVLGRPPPLASVVCVTGGATAGLAGAGELLLEADGALAALLGDRSQLTDPRAMRRLRLQPDGPDGPDAAAVAVVDAVLAVLKEEPDRESSVNRAPVQRP